MREQQARDMFNVAFLIGLLLGMIVGATVTIITLA